MRRVRQRDTAPEVAVRKLLHRSGVRFRICPEQLPGRPDVANVSQRWALFVHGCFWHGHRGCRLATVPRTNSKFWVEKFAANKRRDARKARQLRALGFRVLVVWQCEAADPTLGVRLRKILESRESTT